MRKANMVNINKDYVRKKIKEGGMKYTDLSRVLGLKSDGSLTGMIAAERISLDYLKQLARIVDFPYEEAIRNAKPKAYIKQPINIKHELDNILSMQKEINTSLIKLIAEMN